MDGIEIQTATAEAEALDLHGFLYVPRAAANKHGTHKAGGFAELVDCLKANRIERPEWATPELLQVYEEAQQLAKRNEPLTPEQQKVRKKVKAWKANTVSAVRAPGAAGDKARYPASYAAHFDVLAVDLDGVPSTVARNGQDVATVDALRDALASRGYSAVIHETLTHCAAATKLRLLVQSEPLAISPDGKGWEETRGGDERYNATVLLEQVIAGELGAVECTHAKHNATDCRYVLPTGEEITADRSTYKAAQLFFTTCKDAAWHEVEGKPVTFTELEAAAARYAFPVVTESAPVSATSQPVQVETSLFDAKRTKEVDEITAQTVADLRTVLMDSRMVEQSGQYDVWIKVISALCGSFARASQFANELEALAIEWGDSAQGCEGETAAKIEQNRSKFTRSNPASIFALAKSYGIANPASERAAARRNSTATLGGVKSRQLYPKECEALEAFNAKHGWALVGGKATVIYEDTVADKEDTVTQVRYVSDLELAKMMRDADPVYGFITKTDSKGEEYTVPQRPLNLVEAWTYWRGVRKYTGGVDFYPDAAHCPSNVYNLWRGWQVVPEVGDVSPWLELVEKAICAGDKELMDHFIGYHAHLVQKPAQKPVYALVLRGKPGGGKSAVLLPIRVMLGSAFVSVQGLRKIAGTFNGIVAGKLGVFVDEARQSGKDAADSLKVLISESHITVEKKFKDAEPVHNYARTWIASNHEDAVFVMQNERRFEYYDVADCFVKELHPEVATEFWDRYFGWLNAGGAGALLHFLQGYDLSQSAFDPNKPLITAALKAEAVKNLPDVEAWMMAELRKEMPFNIRAHREGWDNLDVSNCFEDESAASGQLLNTGGVQSRIVHERCADWVNENVNRYTAVKVQPHTIDKRVNELMRHIFGIEKKRQSKGGKTIFYFDDLNYARCQFARFVGLDTLSEFPEDDYPGMQEAYERFTQATAAAAFV